MSICEWEAWKEKNLRYFLNTSVNCAKRNVRKRMCVCAYEEKKTCVCVPGIACMNERYPSPMNNDLFTGVDLCGDI